MLCSVPVFCFLVFFLTQRGEMKVLGLLFSRLVECEYTQLMWKPPLAGAGLRWSGHIQDHSLSGRFFNYLFWEWLIHSAKLTSSSWPSEHSGGERGRFSSPQARRSGHLWGRRAQVVGALMWIGIKETKEARGPRSHVTSLILAGVWILSQKQLATSEGQGS